MLITSDNFLNIHYVSGLLFSNIWIHLSQVFQDIFGHFPFIWKQTFKQFLNKFTTFWVDIFSKTMFDILFIFLSFCVSPVEVKYFSIFIWCFEINYSINHNKIFVWNIHMSVLLNVCAWACLYECVSVCVCGWGLLTFVSMYICMRKLNSIRLPIFDMNKKYFLETKIIFDLTKIEKWFRHNWYSCNFSRKIQGQNSYI